MRMRPRERSVPVCRKLGLGGSQPLAVRLAIGRKDGFAVFGSPGLQPVVQTILAPVSHEGVERPDSGEDVCPHRILALQLLAHELQLVDLPAKIAGGQVDVGHGQQGPARSRAPALPSDEGKEKSQARPACDAAMGAGKERAASTNQTPNLNIVLGTKG